MKILGISGSSRRGSYNWGLLEAARELLPAGASLEIFDVSQFPLFTQDKEQDPPQEIRLFKKKIRDADAILFATPEHNYTITAVMKNAIEWGTDPEETTHGTQNPQQLLVLHQVRVVAFVHSFTCAIYWSISMCMRSTSHSS